LAVSCFCYWCVRSPLRSSVPHHESRPAGETPPRNPPKGSYAGEQFDAIQWTRQKIKAVQARHHDVKKYQVDLSFAEFFNGSCAVRHSNHLASLCGEELFQQLAIRGLIIGN
jgi:hypothetical protein